MPRGCGRGDEGTAGFEASIECSAPPRCFQSPGPEQGPDLGVISSKEGNPAVSHLPTQMVGRERKMKGPPEGAVSREGWLE